MSKCGDCIYYPVCKDYVDENESFPEVGGCKVFKNKTNFVELPCRGVYHVVDRDGYFPIVFFKPIESLRVYEIRNLEFYGYYKTEEEANASLKEREKNETKKM